MRNGGVTLHFSYFFLTVCGITTLVLRLDVAQWPQSASVSIIVSVWPKRAVSFLSVFVKFKSANKAFVMPKCADIKTLIERKTRFYI